MIARDQRHFRVVVKPLVGYFAALAVCTFALVSLVGCVSTEFQTDKVHVTRASVFSDVELEATMRADGTIEFRERLAQSALLNSIPVVPTP